MLEGNRLKVAILHQNQETCILLLSVNGINPHNTLSNRYNCCPILMVTYNLPPLLCMNKKLMMLIVLISRSKQPSNDIDVYIKPLVEDL